MKYLMYCKNFYNCHNVSALSTTIKQKRRENEKLSTALPWASRLRKRLAHFCLVRQDENP
jgi:hypothetical protein